MPHTKPRKPPSEKNIAILTQPEPFSRSSMTRIPIPFRNVPSHEVPMRPRLTVVCSLTALLIAATACGTQPGSAPPANGHSSELIPIICDNPEDPSCCPSFDCNPPPPDPPAGPASLTFTPFSEQASVRLAWTVDRDATWYDVERFDGNAWTWVYSGSATTLRIPIPWAGEFQFHVRSCNGGGCSGFVSGLPTRVSLGPVRPTNGSAVMTFAPQLTPASVDYSDGSSTDYEVSPVIGWGFDILRQDLTQNTCVDMTSATVLDVPGLGKDFHIDVAHTRSELATELGFTSNTGISAKFGNFSAGYNRKKEMISKTKRVEDTTAIVAHLRYELSQRNLADPSLRTLLPSRVSQIQSGGAAAFRRDCGDALVSSIAMGREVDIVIQLVNVEYGSDVLRSQTTALNAELNSYKANYDSTTRQHIIDTYTKYSMVATVVSVGSTSVVSGSTSDLAEVLRYIQAVEGEPATNSAAIGYKTSDYSVPAGQSGYPDYHAAQSVLRRWAAFDAQIAERCTFFDHDLLGMDMARQFSINAATVWRAVPDLDTTCFQMRRAISDNVQNCQDTEKWGQCIAPDSAACIVPMNGSMCVMVSNQIPFWSSIAQTLPLRGHLDSGYREESIWVSEHTCFTGPTMLDLRVGSVDCAGISGCPAVRQGVAVKSPELHRTSGGTNSWDSQAYCLNAGVTLTRPHFYQAGADVNQDETAFGLLPSLPPYQY
jgi:hypothetical protein